jgi:hypothetical protein
VADDSASSIEEPHIERSNERARCDAIGAEGKTLLDEPSAERSARGAEVRAPAACPKPDLR